MTFDNTEHPPERPLEYDEYPSDVADFDDNLDAENNAASDVFEVEADYLSPQDVGFHDDAEIEPTSDGRKSLGEWLAGLFVGIGGSSYGKRLYSLTHAIGVAPNAAVNYVLRGELYLERSEYELAAQDFQKALLLAETELTERDHKSLGVVAQGMQDRALVGYEEALKRQWRREAHLR
jgi:hypothetical protein